MFVRSTMKPSYNCYVVKPEDSLEIVLNTLEKHDIQAVPVVDGEEFRGMVSKQTIFTEYFQSNMEKDDFLHNKVARDIMKYENMFISEEEVFERTLTSFKEFPILAVANKNRKFLGIISRFDVLEQFESAFGTKKKGIRVAFTSEESAGRFSRLSDIIKQLHATIISIATFDETDKLARRVVLKLEPGVDIEKLKKRLEKSGFRVLDITEV